MASLTAHNDDIWLPNRAVDLRAVPSTSAPWRRLARRAVDFRAVPSNAAAITELAFSQRKLALLRNRRREAEAEGRIRRLLIVVKR